MWSLPCFSHLTPLFINWCSTKTPLPHFPTLRTAGQYCIICGSGMWLITVSELVRVCLKSLAQHPVGSLFVAATVRGAPPCGLIAASCEVNLMKQFIFSPTSEWASERVLSHHPLLLEKAAQRYLLLPPFCISLSSFLLSFMLPLFLLTFPHPK